ncbi:hypothetical protein B0H16DRAFT_1683746 [Mycena metata]|uniref:Uncharacterized protein n=1 Tax=Mycena metata TaxID=1033252 RepID=A0AAD7NWW4_9AGAR|nr:hypothetical protein B0H16DRAFT_1683746 [Mycena metata]
MTPRRSADVGMGRHPTDTFLDTKAPRSHNASKNFYYASLVGDKGGIVEPLSTFFSSGPQHAQVYSDLITRKDQADWEYSGPNELMGHGKRFSEKCEDIGGCIAHY